MIDGSCVIMIDVIMIGHPGLGRGCPKGGFSFCWTSAGSHVPKGSGDDNEYDGYDGIEEEKEQILLNVSIPGPAPAVSCPQIGWRVFSSPDWRREQVRYIYYNNGI